MGRRRSRGGGGDALHRLNGLVVEGEELIVHKQSRLRRFARCRGDYHVLCSLAERGAHHHRIDTVLPLPRLVCESHTAGTAVAERVGLRERKLERAARGLGQFFRHKAALV